MQVSTKLFNQQQVNQFKQLNEEIQSIQNKISSGKNILQASDDPVGAVELSGLSQVKGKISQYIENIDSAQSRLSLADSSLNGVINVMIRVKELSIQAANDTHGALDREAIAIELDELKNELLNLGNSVDSSGAYIFSGYQTTTMPFQKDSAGRISYEGDRGVTTVSVSESRTVGTTIDGGTAFMAVKGANGIAPMFEMLENITYAVRTAAESVEKGKSDGAAQLKVENGNPGNWKFTINADGSTADISVDMPGDDLSGLVTAINASGVNVTATLNGSIIELSHATNGPIEISNLQIEDITTALEKPKSWLTFDAVDAEGNALATSQRIYDYDQTIAARLDDISSVQDHVANQRAKVGARSNSLERQRDLLTERKSAVEKDMSEISDADLAELVTSLQSQITGLEASQQAFVKISRLSLFDYIR